MIYRALKIIAIAALAFAAIGYEIAVCSPSHSGYQMCQ